MVPLITFVNTDSRTGYRERYEKKKNAKVTLKIVWGEGKGRGGEGRGVSRLYGGRGNEISLKLTVNHLLNRLLFLCQSCGR